MSGPCRRPWTPQTAGPHGKGRIEVLKLRLGRGAAVRRILGGSLLSLSVLSLAAGSASAQQVSPRQAIGHRATAPHTAHAARGLSPAEAAARAERTGRRVTVSALTTATSATTVSPGGTFNVTETALPVRAWRNGRWKQLDATLHAHPDGTISPAVTTTGLSLSGGGTGQT